MIVTDTKRLVWSGNTYSASQVDHTIVSVILNRPGIAVSYVHSFGPAVDGGKR